jgi:hypothetical protein
VPLAYSRRFAAKACPSLKLTFRQLSSTLKTKIIAFLSLAILFAASAADTTPPKKNKIRLLQLEEMFANMRAKTRWNLDGEMLWGYFFTDPDPKKLEPVAQQLAHDGYRVVDTHPARDHHTYILHVERVEHHTPQTLDARNQEFYRLADKFGIASYDGMDVGPAPSR